MPPTLPSPRRPRQPPDPSPEALAGGLGGMLVAAERVAGTVALGVHGRRRVGVGEQFWQFRPFVAGDAVSRIDWRRSGRADRVFVRETEWDAAQTVALWRDGGAGMAWRSAAGLPEKRARAELLLLATANLLVRGGERVRLLDGAEGNAAGVTAGRGVVPRLAAALARTRAGLPGALPPARGAAVLFSDCLGELEGWSGMLARHAALGVRGVVVQVLDPAEVELPYAGRVAFAPVGGGAGVVVAKVEAVRAAYRERLAARREALAGLCARTGFRLLLHRTDAPARQGLLAVYEALTAR